MLSQTETTLEPSPEFPAPDFDVQVDAWVLVLLVALLVLGGLALFFYGHSSPGF